MLERRRILEISKLAASVLRDTGAADRYLHEGYTRINPFAVADALDLPVMVRPLQDLLGAFLRESQAGILVNAERPPGLVHMTCAHELGHFFLGHETTTDRSLDYGPDAAPMEKEADLFAYQLLMPRALIAYVMQRKGWSSEDLRDPRIIYQLSLRLGTSYTATVWSLWRHAVLGVSAAHARDLAGVQLQRIKRSLAGNQNESITDIWVLNQDDRDLVFEPRAHDRFIVELPSHASSGFLWSLKEATDAGFVLKPVTREYGTDGLSDDPAASIVVGAVSTLRYALSHRGDQPANVRFGLAFEETQPWRAGEMSRAQFSTSAEFEEIRLGLNERTRARLIDEVAST